MRRPQRLSHRRDFAAVYRRGRSYRSGLLALRVLRSREAVTRSGFAVGVAVGNAVVRNRVKRRLREAVRSLAVAEGWDLVLSARPGAAEAEYQRLREEAAELLARAGVLEDAAGRT
jgi:ribonuclease P protein component